MMATSDDFADNTLIHLVASVTGAIELVEYHVIGSHLEFENKDKGEDNTDLMETKFV